MFKWWAGVNFLLLFISFSCGRRLGIFFKVLMIVLYFYWLLFELWAGVSFLFIFISFSCGRRLGILFNFVKRWLYSIVIDYFFRVVGWCQLPVYFYFLFLWKMTRYLVLVCEKKTVLHCSLLLFELWAGVNFLFILFSSPVEDDLVFCSCLSKDYFTLLLLNIVWILGCCQLPFFYFPLEDD